MAKNMSLMVARPCMVSLSLSATMPSTKVLLTGPLPLLCKFQLWISSAVTFPPANALSPTVCRRENSQSMPKCLNCSATFMMTPDSAFVYIALALLTALRGNKTIHTKVMGRELSPTGRQPSPRNYDCTK